jgi:hypothetical protein
MVSVCWLPNIPFPLRYMQLMHSGPDSGLRFHPLGCNAVLFDICSSTFRRNVLSPSFLSKSIADYFLGLVFDPAIGAVCSSGTSANLYPTTRHRISEGSTMACWPVVKQRPRKNQLYNRRYLVTASETSIFVRQQLETATEERFFPCDQCRDVISRIVGAMSNCWTVASR